MHGSCTEVLHSSYIMATRGSPDIYTLSPRVYISGKPLVPMVQVLNKLQVLYYIAMCLYVITVLLYQNHYSVYESGISNDFVPYNSQILFSI